MARIKEIAVLLAAVFMALIVFSFVFTALTSLILPPSHASYSDKLVEDIGGDDFLVATLKGCLKVSERNIPDGNFTAASGTYGYYGAKNISYVDVEGRKGYLVVWKTTPDKYNQFNNDDVNVYISDYAKDDSAKCFIEYSYENKCVYGVIIGTANIKYNEDNLMYDILNLNPSGFKMAYSYVYPNSPSSTYSSPTSHYHTVVGDRYSLSRSDPGAYYDHYEYGDDYDIDDYLEVEGYD